jgi:spore coat protein U-like protein
VRSLATPWTSGVYALLNPTTGAERNHPLTFTIGTVNPMLQSAGLYTDTLTVTITTM